MKSRMLLNLSLLAVLAVLGAIAYFEPGKKEPAETPLTQVEIDKVDTLSLQQGDKTIVLAKKGGHWWVSAPFSAPANDFRVRQLLEIAKTTSDASYSLKPDELAKFELDQPIASLTLGDVVLIFGGADPINMRRYVRIGDTLHLVRDDFSRHLTAQATDYVDKKLLPEDARIQEIALPEWKARLGQDGKWVFEPPQDGGETHIGELLTHWQSARAIDIKHLDKVAEGQKLHIGLANGESVDFVIVQREPELLLVRQDYGIQYEVVGEPARRLLSLNPKPAETRTEETSLPASPAPEAPMDDGGAEEIEAD
ncbi:MULTISPECIES: DUF4340 domain-containing protein [Methylococcus]|uniref:DUF4340 domain-containing protein n=1 Tax=Methylococcus capsulatus TaxID=414 RepID=A0ABZ2F7B8_METCP|nr:MULTISPECIES: DUF4340 domain-containing protein [Methylococcus]MDF9393248.1 DUF4340 domain-containing protein [Methylococcus capsulatus]